MRVEPLLLAALVIGVALIALALALIDPIAGLVGGSVAGLAGAGALARSRAAAERHAADVRVRDLRGRAKEEGHAVAEDAAAVARGADRERTAAELRDRLGL